MCALDEHWAHRGQGPHLTLISSCFYIWSLVTIDHCWPEMLHQSISVVVNVLVWHPRDFRNEVNRTWPFFNDTIVQLQATIFHSVLQPAVRPECCSKDCTAQKIYASVTIFPPSKHLYLPPCVFLVGLVSVGHWREKRFPESFHCQTALNGKKNKHGVSQVFPIGMQTNNDFGRSPGYSYRAATARKKKTWEWWSFRSSWLILRTSVLIWYFPADSLCFSTI